MAKLIAPGNSFTKIPTAVMHDGWWKEVAGPGGNLPVQVPAASLLETIWLKFSRKNSADYTRIIR